MQMRCLFTVFLGSFPGDIPGWWWGTGGGRTQSIFSPLNNARDNLCVSTLWKQMIKKDYQRKRRKSDLGPRSLRSQPFFKVKVGHVLMCCAWASSLSRVWLCYPWAVARQAPLSMGFSRQEYWGGLPCPPPGDLPSPGIKPRSPTLQGDSLPSEPPGSINQKPT